MRYYNMEKTEKITRTKAIIMTLVLHFGLIFGLIYINSDQNTKIMPDFVKEWISGDKTKAAVASSTKRP